MYDYVIDKLFLAVKDVKRQTHKRSEVLINVLTLCRGGYYEGISHYDVEFLQMLLHSIN